MPRQTSAMARHPSRPFHTADTTYGAEQRVGTRTLQADAWTVVRDPITGRLAAAVADGIGDREQSAWTAQMGADHAAAAAARTGSPGRAVREARARRNEIELGYPVYDPDRDYYWDEGDAVVIVAVLEPGAAVLSLAWAGDCRAYRLGHTGDLELLTTDHTHGEMLRQLGILPPDMPSRADHRLTSRLAEGQIGTATVPAALVSRLLLCSDGIGKQLTQDDIEVELGCAADAHQAAALLAARADVDGVERTRSDNITAVVLELDQSVEAAVVPDPHGRTVHGGSADTAASPSGRTW